MFACLSSKTHVKVLQLSQKWSVPDSKTWGQNDKIAYPNIWERKIPGTDIGMIYIHWSWKKDILTYELNLSNWRERREGIETNKNPLGSLKHCS